MLTLTFRPWPWCHWRVKRRCSCVHILRRQLLSMAMSAWPRTKRIKCHLSRFTYFYMIWPSDLDLWPSFFTSAMSIIGYMFCISLVKETKKRIRIPPTWKLFSLTFGLDLVILTLMSLENEGVVVLFTHSEMTIAQYGNECLSKHKQH